jgi:2',3'-cyclic-nucleotide 2'-phosphodiesterase (5'-nucleotidase family)
MGITKREFSYFQDELSLRAYEAAFPLVASNSIDVRTSEPIDGLVKIALIRKGDIQLGFISVLNQRVISEYLLPDLQVQDPQDTILQLSNALRSEGADVIVLHYSYPFDFVAPLLEDHIIDVAFLSDTRVQQKYQFADDQSNHLLTIDTPGQAIVARFKSVDSMYNADIQKIVLSDLAADENLQKQIDGYRSRLDRLLDNQIGTWAKTISTLRSDVRSRESAFVNFVTDAMRVYVDADIAVINGGSIRGNTNYKQGEKITRRDVANELPFRSYLSLASVSGAYIAEMLEQGLSQVENVKGGFPHVSGMKVTFDSSLSVGSRVVSVTIDGKALDDTKTYRLATTDYLATGGDGYPSVENPNDLKVFELLISEVVTDTIATQVRVNPELEGRIVNVSSNED